ncbi:hypothetical protein [Luteolibacter sp. Populi]|uniref:hypothetical protein n=1 Tax=Luteolibacter sp. Populi TaxID=3230487 RepID=UPI003465D71B
MPTPAAITCRASHLGSVKKLDPAILALLREKIPGHFGEGSGNDIDLVLENAVLDPFRFRAGPLVSSLELHLALEGLVGSGAGAARKVGLIFAGGYAFKPGIFGLMFDRGFRTNDDENPRFTTPARQGCAVFLDPIGRLRAPGIPDRNTSQDFQKEVLFTATHELGHVFNLGHQENLNNFMRSSLPGSVFPAAAFKFLEGQKRILSRCSRDVHVEPGGSKWGDLGPDIDIRDGGVYDRPPGNLPVDPKSPLRLQIGLAMTAFHYYQPMELDVKLGLARGTKASVTVPDRVDCGYPDFTLWIEDSDGEIRRYRPLNHYCSLPGDLEIKPGKPFRRDISIFGQAGGYTFRKTGPHRIWAEFQIPGGRCIRSNVLDFELLGPGRKMQSRADHRKLVQIAGPALFYRSLHLGSRSGRALKQLADSKGKDFIADRAAACYSLGRILAKRALAEKGKADARTAIRHLSVAAGYEDIGINRRHIALELTRQLKRLL